MDGLIVPKARTEHLVFSAFDGELLIQDTKRHRAHALNEQAAAVFRLADGSRTVEQIARDASAQLDMPVSEEMVWYSLGILQRNHLLEEQVVTKADRLTRKALMKRAGAAAALASIATIVVPTAASAATGCQGAYHGIGNIYSGRCSTSNHCCSGLQCVPVSSHQHICITH